MLKHGGRLHEASYRYNIPLSQWLDLSTGVNPRNYPIPVISLQAWNRLPEQDDGLVDAACRYYQCPAAQPVAGSQAAIQALPLIRRQLHPASRTVAVPATGYREHRHAWLNQGYDVVYYQDEPAPEQLASVDVVVIINPNNPTGCFQSPEKLQAWHQLLSQRRAWLVIDEAFMDCTPEWSLCKYTGQPDLIILRSVGKFFGLAGIRAGFVLAQSHILTALHEHLGPWTVSGPARQICKAALSDTRWQQRNLQFLASSSDRLNHLLAQSFTNIEGTLLFSRVLTAQAREIHQQLCRRGILTRLLDEQNGLRFGLPDTEADWEKLATALKSLKSEDSYHPGKQAT